MCEICTRWRERIAAAKARDDRQHAGILTKMYQAHRGDTRYHPVLAMLRRVG